MVSLLSFILISFVTAVVGLLSTMALLSLFSRSSPDGKARPAVSGRPGGGTTRAAAAAAKPSRQASGTEFLGSQVGGESVMNHSYTDFPWKLLAYDIGQFFRLAWALPYIVWPLAPTDSGSLDELAWTPQNAFCIVVHVVI